MMLLLLRHTRPGIAEGICYGRTDVDVADSFAGDAQALLDAVGGAMSAAEDAALHAENAALPAANAALFSSPLRRCAKLARRLGAPRFDARLQELDFGAWEARPWSEIDRASLDAWAADIAGWRPPGGESVAELAARAGAFLDELRVSTVSAACLVTHGGVVRTLCARLWGRPLEQACGMVVPFASALKLRWDGNGGAQLLAAHGYAELPGWMDR